MTTPIHLTRRECKRFLQALARAIDYTESLVDAHHVEWARRCRPGKSVRHKVVPKEDRPYVARLNRDIAAFRRLGTKVKAMDAEK